MTSVLIGGDVCPQGKNQLDFRNGDSPAIFGDVLEVFQQADFSIVNLECPFIAESTPAAKPPPIFGADPACIRGLINANIRAVNLGNNHILDHGEAGLLTTLDTCDAQGVLHVGAGKNLETAGQVLIVSVGGQRIGFLSMADQEFSIAGPNSGGANPTDLIWYVRTLKRIRDQIDYLIVLLHEGVQHYPYPTPRLQKICRFLVEEGAAAVICQHSHCAGSYEFHTGAPIIYGQGDLINDIQVNRSLKDWNRGILVKLTLPGEGLPVKLEIIPFQQHTDICGIQRMADKECQAFLAEINERNRLLDDETELENCWKHYCQTIQHYYVGGLLGLPVILRRINRRIPFARRLLNSRQVINLLTYIRCQSHRESLETILTQLSRQALLKNSNTNPGNHNL